MRARAITARATSTPCTRREASVLRPLASLVFRSLLPRACVAAALLALCGAAPARAGGPREERPAARSSSWWKAAWPWRRVLTLPPGAAAPSRTAFASFSTHGALRPDGSDLRVVALDGKPVGVELLQVGPGDRVSFFFQADDPDAHVYEAYWGNDAPTEPAPKWSRDAGLVCEVRRWDGAFPVDSQEGIDLALATAREVEARVLRRKIFDGGNPGGASRTYVGVYRGFFRVPEAGDYDLCMASSDASVLRVADREAVLWSRFKGPYPALRGRFRTTVHLEAGSHPLEYLHFCAGGVPAAAEVGIKKSSEEGWRLLGDADYVQAIPAAAGAVESAARAAPADFTWETVQHLEADGRYLVHVAFEARGAAAGGRCAWDFGDGRGGEGVKVTHAFIGRGLRAVRLTSTRAGGAAAVGTQRVAAEPNWGQLVGVVPGSEARWTDELREAIAVGLSGHEIEPAMVAAEALGSDEALRAVGENAFLRAPDLRGAVRVGVFLTLAEFFDDPRTRDDVRESTALRLALETDGAPAPAAARAALAGARHAMRRRGDASGALAMLRRAPVADLSPDDRRRAALVRIDALASLDRVDEARAVLAQTPDRTGGDARAADASRRARLHAGVARLAMGDAAAAAAEVEAVLDDFPRERLRSEAPVLLAEACLALDDVLGAQALLERALLLDPIGARAPRALFLLARACERSGDGAGAARARARLKAEFPYADEAAEAGRRDAPVR